MKDGGCPSSPDSALKAWSFPVESLLLNLHRKTKGAGVSWQQVLEQQYMNSERRGLQLWVHGLLLTFHLGHQTMGKCQAHPRFTPKALSHISTLSRNTLTDRDEFHQTLTSLSPVMLMPEPTITQEDCTRAGCWDFSYCPSHFCFLAAVRWATSFTICTHHNELLCHRPKDGEAKWPQAETSSTMRHQLSSILLCPSDRNLTNNWHFICSFLK